MTRTSITKKIFIAVLAIFLIALLLQWLVMNRFFGELYLRMTVSSQQSELDNTADGFVSSGGSGFSSSLSAYTNSTGAPVLVVRGDQNIADQRFWSYFNILEVRLSDGQTIHVPDYALESTTGGAILTQGRYLHIYAAKLGNSDFYEPLLIYSGGDSYVNKESVKNYKTDGSIEQIDVYGTISRRRYTSQSGTRTENLAHMLYDRVKDGLIKNLPAEEALAGLSSGTFSDAGADYRIYSSKCSVGGVDHYLITLRQIPEPGVEREFVNRFFLIFYGVLAALLIIASWILSRSVSKPLIQLSSITQKLAKLDFRERVSVRSSDEVGMLSESINTMADNLERSIKELENATERAKGNEKRIQKLMNDLAHEFKTPLFIISSYTEALEADLPGVDKAKYYSVINSEIDKLSDMVNEVIALSALQSGRWNTEIGSYDLRELIETTVEKFEKRFEEGGLSVSVDVPEVSVLMDPRRIERVLTNFFSNALKYSRGARCLDIHTESRDDESIFVFVGNTGELSDEDRDRIWERYYSSDGSNEARLPSEGIGLDIVRAILNAHGSEHGVIQRGDMVFFYFSLKLSEPSKNT